MNAKRSSVTVCLFQVAEALDASNLMAEESVALIKTVRDAWRVICLLTCDV